MYFVYMRNRSPAKSAASSPPVPPRISMMAFFESCGSLGMSSSLISSSMRTMAGSSSAISSRAISRISSSLSLASTSFASARLARAVRKRSDVSMIGSSSL